MCFTISKTLTHKIDYHFILDLQGIKNCNRNGHARNVSSNLSSQFCLSLYLAPLSMHRMPLKSYGENIKQVSSASTKQNIHYYYNLFIYLLIFLTE